MSKSVLVIDTPESCGECMIRNLTDHCQAAEKSVEEFRENKPEWCPMLEESILMPYYIAYLKRNGYIVKRFTKSMQADSDECVDLDEKGKSKDCCGCSCSVCLIQ